VTSNKLNQLLYVATTYRRRLQTGSGKNVQARSCVLPLLFCPGYNFNIKMVNIAAIRCVLVTKNSPKCLCGRSSASTPLGEEEQLPQTPS